MKLILYLLLLLTLLEVAKCARILVLFPAPAPSHYFLGNALARGLVEAGHEVTMVSPFFDKDPPKNGKYHEIVLAGFLEERDEKMKELNLNFFDMENMNPILTMLFMNMMGNDIARKTLEHPSIKQLIESDEHFDAVIMEQFLTDALKVLAYHYKAPLILFSNGGANPWVNHIAGNPSPPSFIPEVFLGYKTPMSFWQRLINFLYSVSAYLNYKLLFLPTQNKIMKENFPNAPDLSVLFYNASLILLNSHESTNQPVPLVPNMVPIGGFHIKPSKELPQDLKEFMDSAEEGVVYFSMGSTLDSTQMSEEARETILKAFGKIKQKVLWKWDKEILPGKPDNVKLSKWFPQQEILAHPKTRLFITHGGLLSATETIYHGVPVLNFPIFADQKANAANAEINGIGITLPFSEITEQKLSNALDKLLNDSKYRNAVKVRSSLLHDRPVKPLDLAIYWIEFVIRHNGAPHLRVAALDLSWYQYFLVDVIAFIGLFGISLLVVICTVVKRIFCRNKVSKVKIKKS